MSFASIAGGFLQGLGAGMAKSQQVRDEDDILTRRQMVLEKLRMDREDAQDAKTTTAAAAKANRATAGQIALMAPDEATWSSRRSELAKTNPDVAALMGDFSPQRRDALLAEAGLAKEESSRLNPGVNIVPGGSRMYDKDGYPIPIKDEPRPSPTPAKSEFNAAPILERAAASKTISPADASRVRTSLGANGQGAFDKWISDNGIRISGGSPGGGTDRSALIAEAEAAIARGADPVRVRARLNSMIGAQ